MSTASSTSTSTSTAASTFSIAPEQSRFSEDWDGSVLVTMDGLHHVLSKDEAIGFAIGLLNIATGRQW